MADRGRSPDGSCSGGKQCGTGRTRMRPIPDASMEKLMSFIKSFVKLGIFLHERA